MTAVSNRPRASTAKPYDMLPGSLVDQLAEAVASPPDSRARSVAVAGLVVEVFETIRWLHGPDPDREELTSLYRVLAEAYAHRSRMAARSVGARP